MFADAHPSRRKRDPSALPRRRFVEDDDNFLVNCPRCQSPLTLRMGKRGPYYHCRCTQDNGRNHTAATR